MFYKEIGDIVYIETGQIKKEDPSAIADVTFPFMTDFPLSDNGLSSEVRKEISV